MLIVDVASEEEEIKYKFMELYILLIGRVFSMIDLEIVLSCSEG